MTKATKLKTGDVKKIAHDGTIINGHPWAVVGNNGKYAFSTLTREYARSLKAGNTGERIAKVLRVTPKTATVEISK